MTRAAVARSNMAMGQLLTNEVLDASILHAMYDVPRELFVPAHLQHCSYVDNDLEVAPNRFLIAPLTFARLLELAKLTPSCRILNIGSLSGYTAAILALIGGHVVAVENDPTFAEETRTNLETLGIADVDVQVMESLENGYGSSAPYDVIVISGAVQSIPKALEAQLGLNGRLVAVKYLASRPGNRDGLGRGMLGKRIGSHLQFREYFDAPASLVPGFEAVPGFTF